MRAVPFDYFAPEDAETVGELLAEHGPDARLLAGGQSLVPRLGLRVDRPRVLIDLARVEALAGVRRDGPDLVVGAATRQRDLELDPLVRDVPVLGDALAVIGHVPTRNRGTVGGSIAFADPNAELPTVLLGLGGSVVVERQGGRRTIPAIDLFLDRFMTSLRYDDVILEVRFPVPGPSSRAAFVQRAFRRRVKATAVARVSGDELTLAVAGLGRAPAVLLGAPGGDVGELVARAQALIEDDGNFAAPAHYRAHLIESAVVRAVESVVGEGPPGGGPDEQSKGNEGER